MEKLYNKLIELEKRIEDSFADDPVIELIYSHSKILTGENGINLLISSYSKKHIPLPIENTILFNIAFEIGILTGILDTTDNISYIYTDFTDKYSVDDTEELKRNLEEASKYLNVFSTKIKPNNLRCKALNTLLSSVNVLISHNNFLIYNNQTLDYCKISGCISLIAISIKKFVKHYLELDFAEVNSIKVTNIFFFMGVLTGIMNAKNITNKSIFENIEFISKIFKAL